MEINKPEQVLALQLLNTYMNTLSKNDESGMFDLILQSVMDSIGSDNTDKNIENIVNSFADNMASSLGNSGALQSLDSQEINSSLSIEDILNYRDVIGQGMDKINQSVDKNNLQNSSERINKAVSDASKKYGVSEALIHSVIKNESSYNPNAVSSAGASGLMQVMPQNFKSYGIEDPFNIEDNVDGGTRILKEYLDRYDGNVEMGLMAYNAGPGTVARRGVKSIDDLYKLPKETQNYVVKVMNTYKELTK